MTNKQLTALNPILVVILIVLGIVIWFTASQVVAIIAIIPLALLGLNITGVLGSLFGKDETPTND